MILMPLPDQDFDPSETSIPWKILNENSIDITFATPSGHPGQGDFRMVTGFELGIWKNILMANNEALNCYSAMIKSKSFNSPISYNDINASEYSGIILPGGHAPGMKPYLESTKLQSIIVNFFEQNKPVGAICHGVLLVARSINPKTGKSIINNYRTTCLLKTQEMFAYYITSLWLGDYYRTYPITVEDEVRSFLGDPNFFESGNLGIFRDSRENPSNGFAVLDRKYLSARWPGDAFHFSYEFLKLLNKK